MVENRAARLTIVALALLLCPSGCTRPPRPRWPEPLSPEGYGYYLRGQLAMRAGNHAEAILNFRAATQMAPGEAPIELALIDALRRGKRTEQARQHADRACKRWPREPDVWLMRGELYREVAGRRPEPRSKAAATAIRSFRRALRLDPRLERAHLGLADAYLAVGKRDKGLSVYRTYVASAPESIDAHLAYAKALIDGRDYGQAAAQLRRVVTLDFDHVDGYRQLARALRLAGRDRESLEVLRQAFARSAEPELGLQLVRQLAEAGLRAEAETVLGDLGDDATDEDALLAVGERWLALGQWQAAVELARRAEEREPTSGLGALLRARALLVGKRVDDALAGLLAVSTSQVAYPECQALAGRVLAERGDLDGARAALRPALAQHPHHVALVISQAMLHELDRRPDAARALLEKALGRALDRPRLLHALAGLHDRQKRTEKAIATMERALVVDPDDAIALGFIGASLTERGVELARAAQLLERAVRLAPGDAGLLGRYGRLLYVQKHYPRARAVLERAARILPDDAELLFYLGEVALVQSERERGLELLRRAQSLAPPAPLAARIEARIRALMAQ